LAKLQQSVLRAAKSAYANAIERAIKRGELATNTNVRLMIDILISPFLFRMIENVAARQSDIQPLIDVALAAFAPPKERVRRTG
jgi:hypothetical protein